MNATAIIAVHTGIYTDDFVSHYALEHISIKMDILIARAITSSEKKKMLGANYSEHILSAKNHNKAILNYTLIEIACLILIFFVQSRYIISLVNKL